MPTAEPNDAAIAAQRARVELLDAAVRRDLLDDGALAAYQAACRELEGLIEARGDDRRHHFVIVIPVADSPALLENCLGSLLALCEAYAYGGRDGGVYRRVRVLLADDSAHPGHRERHRGLADAYSARGLQIEYFGVEAQLALLDRLSGLDLGGIIGSHPREAFGHKGQAMMRNIAYLRLAEIAAVRGGGPLLFYTVDADQAFAINAPTARGPERRCAVNYLYHLDRLFAGGRVQVLTGKVVGDPPVSPAVMAGRFLDDVLGFLQAIAPAGPHAAYRQPEAQPTGAGEAAYHDMADLFGFAGRDAEYRYRCTLPGTPRNLDCFAEFARRLGGFLHGEHPTRITWFEPQLPSDVSVPARTVYTGNYVFTPAALDRFIPFAPLRLRMSGPTMGRILKAELGEAFVSANLPMLHARTLAETHASEFRPGVVSEDGRTALCDEAQRQFYGDVMLFSMERLCEMGYPGRRLSSEQLGQVLDSVRAQMRERYRGRQVAMLESLDRLENLLAEPAMWWQHEAEAETALAQFQGFAGDIRRNFGADSPCHTQIHDKDVAQRWRDRQLAALANLDADREAWAEARSQLTTG